MDELIERYAALMGMKPHREVLEVVPVDDGHAVRTHDGQWTLVRDNAVVGPTELPELTVVRDAGVVERQFADGGPVKGPGAVLADDGPELIAPRPASKRRSRS